MSETRVIYGSLSTGELLGELRYESVAYADALNGAGSATVTLPLRHNRPGQPQVVTSASLAPARTYLAIERDAVPRWAGPIWQASANPDDNVLQLNALGPHSYLRRRFVRADLVYSQVDQYAICRSIIDYAQGITGGDIGIDTTATNLSGTLRDRTYQGSERRNVGVIIEQLAAVNNGFSFSYSPIRTGSSYGWRHVLAEPAGRSTDIVFELGVNCSLASHRQDTALIASQVDALGAGNGPDKLISTASDPNLLATFPLLEATTTHSDVVVAATLDSYAQFRLQRGSQSMEFVKLDVFPDTIPRVGAYQVGDLVTIRGDYGWLTLDSSFRITEISTDVSGGAEVVIVTAAPAELFQ
jgi:hypothetical protein